ncbi:reactive intermediate/imine deaminase [Frondihabitans sucicola]|uniref:Reactive intermediate/imine deaminase n=1 Tax=Frondihabitans sucicola TaxID=1268041 RepID=A0ABN6XZY5_9MICO|nr:RidA family protein [Frondihabitans sucicola]BDZ49185.1 reactive intermediate/imine deaminase [Frondihabitans sucicola]
MTDSKTPVVTDGAPTPMTTFSQGVQKSGFLSVSGQGPQDPATGAYLFPGDLTSQTIRTLDNVKAIVEGAGGTFEDVLSLRVFLTQRSDFAEMNAAYAEYITANVPSGAYPTRTTVFVELPNEAMLVEIDALAVLDR